MLWSHVGWHCLVGVLWSHQLFCVSCSFDEPFQYDDSIPWVMGGALSHQSFRGYIARVTLYHGLRLNSEHVRCSGLVEALCRCGGHVEFRVYDYACYNKMHDCTVGGTHISKLPSLAMHPELLCRHTQLFVTSEVSKLHRKDSCGELCLCICCFVRPSATTPMPRGRSYQ